MIVSSDTGARGTYAASAARLPAYPALTTPILLISPFWDETQTHAAADAGGLNHLRTAMSRAWRNAPWSSDFSMLDGFFKRPLRQTDRDVRLIYETLRDLPDRPLVGQSAYFGVKWELWN